MTAELLREAAKVLRNPYRCNTNAHDPLVAKWLDDVAAGWMWDDDPEDVETPDGWPLTLEESMDMHPLNIARAILGESADDVLDPALDGTAAGAQCPPGQEEAWSREFGACPECKATWPNLHVYTRNPQAVLCVKCGWAA